MSDENLTLEEKVDKILKYQQRMYRWQLAKSIINLLLFIVFIVLPIVWLIYWINSVDFSGYMETYNNLKESAGGIDKLNEALKKLSF